MREKEEGRERYGERGTRRDRERKGERNVEGESRKGKGVRGKWEGQGKERDGIDEYACTWLNREAQPPSL